MPPTWPAFILTYQFFVYSDLCKGLRFLGGLTYLFIKVTFSGALLIRCVAYIIVVCS